MFTQEVQTFPPHSLPDPEVTVGENSVIPDGVKVGKNTAISGDTIVGDYPDGLLASGNYIIKAGGVK